MMKRKGFDPDHTPAASVVIPCSRSHAKELRECLKGLGNQDSDQPFEVIVVDSASDPLVLEVASDYCFVRLVRSDTPLGCGAARNFGVTHARGDIIAFLDADCVPEPTWLSAALAGLSAGAMIVGGPILDYRKKSPIASADNLLAFIDRLPGRPKEVCRGHPGAQMALARATIIEAGGFLDMPGEDFMFCSKIVPKAPHLCIFLPDMQVRHFGRNTISGLWSHFVDYGRTRGRYNPHVKPLHRKLGRLRIMAVPFVLWRLTYIFRRVFVHAPSRLPSLLTLLPLLLIGTAGGAIGFRRGCDEFYAGDDADPDEGRHLY